MLEEIIMKENEVEQDTLDRLLNLKKVLTGNNPEPVKEEKTKNCLMDEVSDNLQKSQIIHDLVIDISSSIQGGR